MSCSSYPFSWLVIVTSLGLSACSDNTPVTPTPPSVDAGADGSQRNTQPDATSTSDATDARVDATDIRDASDASDGNSGSSLTPQRVSEIRVCMEARWGSAQTRAAGDVSDDFDACTTAAENAGDSANANFSQVIDGWAEPDPADHSRLRRVAPRDH